MAFKSVLIATCISVASVSKQESWTMTKSTEWSKMSLTTWIGKRFLELDVRHIAGQAQSASQTLPLMPFFQTRSDAKPKLRGVDNINSQITTPGLITTLVLNFGTFVLGLPKAWICSMAVASTYLPVIMGTPATSTAMEIFSSVQPVLPCLRDITHRFLLMLCRRVFYRLFLARQASPPSPRTKGD